MLIFVADITNGLYLIVNMENAALLIAIVQHAIDGIITMDDCGTIESINPSGCKLFNYTQEEVIGKNIDMLMSDPDDDTGEGFFQRCCSNGISEVVTGGTEILGLRKEGTGFPFRLALSQVQYSGRIIYAGFIHDLTKEKEAEGQLRDYATDLELQVEQRTMELRMSLDKEKELGMLKSRFVSIASHEFRTPLTAIQLSSYLIEKYADSAVNSRQINKHVELIKSGVANLTTILNDFLSLEKLESGKEQAKFGTFDLVKFCEDITVEMQALAKDNQNIIYQHTGVNNQLNSDQGMLKKCIVNLISNAIKYSGENTFIDFTTEIDQENCIIKVEDNGIGIPETDHKHLFEAFFRAHNTGTIPGTGLGLNIVGRYTDLMNGTIQFKSKVNEGTLFTITFPTA
jgi:two-component system sensor kinase FixL